MNVFMYRLGVFMYRLQSARCFYESLCFTCNGVCFTCSVFSEKVIMMFLKLLCLAVVLLLMLIVTPFLYIISQILLIRWRYRHIPSPKVKSFFLGHAKDFEDIEKSGGHYSMLIADWMKQHGSIFVLFLVNTARVMCIEPNVVKELLVSSLTVKPKEYYGGIQTVFGDIYLGNGVFTQLDNTQWTKQRHAMNPAFKRGCLKNFLPQFNASMNELITVLKSKAGTQNEIHLVNELNKVSMDIIAKVALGMNDEHVIGHEDTPFSIAIDQTLEGVMMQLKLSIFSRIDPRRESRKVRDVSRKANKFLRNAGRNAVTKRLQDMQDGKEYPQDVLNQILQTYVAGQKVTENEMESILNEFATIFLGGSETTTPMVAFTFELVGRRPDIYKKIKEEVDRVLGDKELVTYDDTVKMEYLSLVFKEVLRLFPPVPGILRINEYDLVINGVKIPAGSSIELNTYALSRDERFWDEPDKFDPERFHINTDRNNYAYFPFALGSRACIGQQFAMIEAKVIVSKMFQIFDFTLVPGVELQYIHHGTIKPKNKTPVYLTQRMK